MNNTLFEKHQIIRIEVLNNTLLKEKYLELAKTHNNKVLSTNPAPEYNFPILIPETTTVSLQPVLTPFNMQIKFNSTFYSKTFKKPFENCGFSTKNAINYVIRNANATENGYIFSCEDVITLEQFTPLYYIQTWVPLIIQIV